jgi:DNA-binding SARP family transcriptional activator
MDFRILGSLEVRTGSGRPCPLARRKQRLLLAVLLFNANRAVPTERIIDWLWGDQPPASAAQNLHSYVSDLRRRLGSDGRDGARIQTRSGGYLLRVDPGELDAEVFDELAARGQRAANEGRHALAVEQFTRALGLWRADVVLEGLALPESLRAEVARLEQLRAAVTEAAFDARLAVGQHRELIPDLEAATRQQPLRERLWAQRMLALYRSGRQADALSAYRQLRTMLAAELGVYPGPDLQRLHQQILDADPALAAPTLSARPPRPAQLPPDLSTFTGRGNELAQLLALPADQPNTLPAAVISAVDGMAGIGKTALAVHASHQLAARYPDGQVFADLNGFAQDMDPVSPADALDRMLRSLGIAGEQIPDTVEERAALWRTRLADQRMLIVLDNAADEAQVRPLLPASPGCLVLITSRRRLSGLDDVHLISLDILPPQDAVSLFTRIAGEDRLAGQPAKLITDVVELCGRLPLAIRIAAARLRARPTWTLTHLVDRLRDQQHRLAELETGQRSVTAAIDLSYSYLTAGQQEMFQLLSLHPGFDIDTHAAAALADITAQQAARVLDDLLDTHLLRQHLPDRYRFHDLLFVYARQVCTDQQPEPRQRDALTRLFDHYSYATTAAMELLYPFDSPGHRPRLPQSETLISAPASRSHAKTWLDTELDNLLAVASHAADHGRPAYTIHLSRTLHRHLLTRARLSDAETLHARAFTAARELGDRPGELDALCGLGDIGYQQGQYKPATDCYQRALHIATEIGDRAGELHALRGLGHLSRAQGWHDLAAHYFGQALDIAHSITSRPGELDALCGLGAVHRLQGQYKPATDCYQQALRIATEIGDRAGELYALRGLGNIHRLQGRHEPATDCYQRALHIATEIGDRAGELYALRGLGYLHYTQGQYELASDCFGRSLGIATEIGDRAGELYALHGLGNIHRLQGRHEPATDCYQRALHIATEIGDRNYQFEALHGLGNTRQATGHPAEALTPHRSALQLARDLDQPTDQARALHGLAHAHNDLGQREHARKLWQQALNILTDLDITQVEEISTKEIHALLATIE